MADRMDELGLFVVERLRAVLPDFEVSYRADTDALGIPMIAFRIRRWSRDAWLEDYHDDINMAARCKCTSLVCSISINSHVVLEDGGYPAYLFQQVLDGWVKHRLKERGVL